MRRSDIWPRLVPSRPRTDRPARETPAAHFGLRLECLGRREFQRPKHFVVLLLQLFFYSPVGLTAE